MGPIARESEALTPDNEADMLSSTCRLGQLNFIHPLRIISFFIISKIHKRKS